MPRGTAASTREEKLGWLRAHPEVWDLPRHQIRDKLASARLCAFTTYPMDLQLGKLIDELKREQAGGGKRI